MEDVAGEELGDRGGHDVGRALEVAGDPVDLGTGERSSS
ncbi:hypothetical protein SAMN06272765_6183 [Streptomyces sp. Ag109_G2-15]|nr:hypothetical protein SAMN06272765_6183 [Streptomyces sp. Ag109_G2-15]